MRFGLQALRSTCTLALQTFLCLHGDPSSKPFCANIHTFTSAVIFVTSQTNGHTITQRMLSATPLVYRLPSNSHLTPCSKVETLGVKPDFRLPNLSKLHVYQDDSTRCCRGVYDTVCRVLKSKVLLYVSAHGKQLSSASHVPLEVRSVLQALKGRCGVISRS